MVRVETEKAIDLEIHTQALTPEDAVEKVRSVLGELVVKRVTLSDRPHGSDLNPERQLAAKKRRSAWRRMISG